MIDLRPFRICSDVEETRKKYQNQILSKSEEIAWTQDKWYSSEKIQEHKDKFEKFISQIFNIK